MAEALAGMTLTIEGRVFRPSAFASALQVGYAAAALRRAGLAELSRDAVGGVLDPLFTAVLDTGEFVHVLAAAFVEEKDGKLTPWTREGARELAGLLGGPAGAQHFLELHSLTVVMLADFFGPGLGSSRTSPSSGRTPATTTTSPTPTRTPDPTTTEGPSSSASSSPSSGSSPAGIPSALTG